MSIKVSDKNYIGITGQRRKTSSRLNTFNIFRITETNQHFLNHFRNFEITDTVKNDNFFWSIYLAIEDDWWDNISFKFYQSSYYWYILCELNNIINPYEELVPGQQIKVLKQDYIYDIFKGMAEISDL